MKLKILLEELDEAKLMDAIRKLQAIANQEPEMSIGDEDIAKYGLGKVKSNVLSHFKKVKTESKSIIDGLGLDKETADQIKDSFVEGLLGSRQVLAAMVSTLIKNGDSEDGATDFLQSLFDIYEQWEDKSDSKQSLTSVAKEIKDEAGNSDEKEEAPKETKDEDNGNAISAGAKSYKKGTVAYKKKYAVLKKRVDAAKAAKDKATTPKGKKTANAKLRIANAAMKEFRLTSV